MKAKPPPLCADPDSAPAPLSASVLLIVVEGAAPSSSSSLSEAASSLSTTSPSLQGNGQGEIKKESCQIHVYRKKNSSVQQELAGGTRVIHSPIAAVTVDVSKCTGGSKMTTSAAVFSRLALLSLKVENQSMIKTSNYHFTPLLNKSNK